MPAFIPVLLIGTGVVTGVTGAASAVRGGMLMRQAKARADAAKSAYESELDVTKGAVQQTNARAVEYGRSQAEAITLVVTRMAEFLRRHEKLVTERASELLDGIYLDVGSAEAFDAPGITMTEVGGTAATAAGGAAATYVGIPLLAAKFGAASTGTAITQLGGAAARNATLAYLGGGSLATGGGGMALGAAALNVVTIGPTILVAGLAFAGKGQQALTQAIEYEADVAISIEEQRQLQARLELVDTRIDELMSVLTRLVERGVQALDTLESHDVFDADEHGEEFQSAIAHAIAVREVASTPVLTDEGELVPETERIVLKYGVADE